jgi:hypothetical protein
MRRHAAHGLGQKCPHLLAQRFVLSRNGRRVQRVKLAHANTSVIKKVFMGSLFMAKRSSNTKWQLIALHYFDA